MTGDKSRTSIFRHRTGRLSMICIDGNWRIAAAALLLAAGGSAMAGSLGGPLELQDEGSFFVNGQPTQSTHPGTAVGGISQPGTITVNQMYVQYRIPKTVSGPAIVMVHGSGHTGATYETTPDGREGWATYFARKGFPVYVVDHSGRGRSGFNPTVINRARAEANAGLLPDIQIAPRERAWYFFRIGATYPTPFPGSQFPVEAFDQYTAQLVPNAEATLPGAGANTVQALGVLLDKIGPAVVMVHSQSGAYGMDLVRARAAKMLSFINIEGNCAPVPNGDERRNGCAATVNAIKSAGGSAKFLLLPEAGHKGNTHMLMMDKNNLEIA